MNTTTARVVSIHLHPAESGTPMQSVKEIELVAGKGIAGEPRYFGKLSRKTGQPSRRQVSLMEREQIAEHAWFAIDCSRCGAREHRDHGCGPG